METNSNKNFNSLFESLSKTKPKADQLLHLATKLAASVESKQDIIDFLEIVHLENVNLVFSKSEKRSEWLIVLLALIEKVGYNTGQLLKQRCKRYGDKPLFMTIHGDELKSISYSETWKRIQEIGQALISFTENSKKAVIGIYSPNSLNSAMVDLAGLSFNFLTVPIPTNISSNHLQYIIDHANISHIFASGDDQHQMLQKFNKENKNLKIADLNDNTKLISQAIGWKQFLARGNDVSPENINERIEQTGMNKLATIMYTSGTTADPKGIMFTQTNLVFKRIARGLALPEISNQDVFLSYLPIHHTFGRFLELMGSIFWGATYCFAVFISIPNRWNQLYENVSTTLSLETSSADEILQAVNKVTGGNLKIGLSAAGYLDPEVFLFFQRNQIHLLSGYGMTEATGGILMTNPGDYEINSVGIPLPGIEVELAPDGELLIRGAYISPGYYGDPILPTMTDGWFHTGDIFKIKNTHYFIIDRKKEIYKNSRGQTIAPQKIEHMFEDFDAICSAFLVGDGLEYNTLLIYPDPNYENGNNINEAVDRDYFKSLVQSVNSFLTPYERIVDFTIVERDFTFDRGERTQKNTYKRKRVLKNFSDTVKPMYAKNYFSLMHGGKEIRIPNWLIREKGVTTRNINWDGNTLSISGERNTVSISWCNDKISIGNYSYEIKSDTLDLQLFLLSPVLWLGNIALVKFIGSPIFRTNEFITPIEIIFDRQLLSDPASSPDHYNIQLLKNALREKAFSLQLLHQAAIYLQYARGYELSIVLNYINQTIITEKGDLHHFALQLLLRKHDQAAPRTRIRILEYILPHIEGDLFIDLLKEIHNEAPGSVAAHEIALDVKRLRTTHFNAILETLSKYCEIAQTLTVTEIKLVKALLKTITEYGIKHPNSFIWARAELIRWELSNVSKSIEALSHKLFSQLTDGFRTWLEPPNQLAIDRDAGVEYTWKDLIIFDTNVETAYQKKINNAFERHAVLKEATFLFSRGNLITIKDIQMQGIWVSLLGQNHGKSVFRVLVQTRSGESYNFAINVNEEQSKDFIKNEIRWLILTGSSKFGPKLVEDFGGYWPDLDIYTEEYIPGETLHQYLDRFKLEIADPKFADRWRLRWLHFIWSGLMAYFNFWNRSGNRLRITNPSPENLIVPEYDYTTGTRLISISDRDENFKLPELFFSLYEDFIILTEQTYPGLKRLADWELLFTAMLQVVPLKKGLAILNNLIEDIQQDVYSERSEKLGLTGKRIINFIEESDKNGVLTKPVVFAAIRFDHWFALNPKATIEARGSFLKDLYKDYLLRNLLNDYPETRIRFFLMTCFQNASKNLKAELLDLQRALQAKELNLDELDSRLQLIHENIQLSEDEEYFLTRLLFEHLEPAEYGELITWDIGSKTKLDLVSTIQDKYGELYRIRPPFHAREIAKFYTLLLKSNLHSVFQPQHEFLFVINSNNQLIGGVFWKKSEHKLAYLERIVIHQDYRNRRLSSHLLNELFSRLSDRHFEYITVGFFQARLFYNNGFSINRRFGGLVKSLN